MDNFKIVIVLGGLVIAGFVLNRCNRDPNPSDTPTLGVNDTAKVFVDGDKITVIKRNADGTDSVTTKFVPDRGTVTFLKNGDIAINVKEFGMQLEPGVGLIASSEGGAVSFDVQLLYWKRMGLNLGTALRVGVPAKNMDEVIKNGIRPFIGVSYKLPWKLVSNTSLMLGYEPLQKLPCVGLRIAL